MNLKVKLHTAVFFLLAISLLTILRVSYFFLYPFIVFLTLYLFRFSLSRNFIILCLLILAGWFLSLRHSFYPMYNLLSLFYVLPFIMFIYSRPQQRVSENDLVESFLNVTSVIMVMNNIVGYFQFYFFIDPSIPQDDNFLGLFGDYSLGCNGLVIVNSILSYYYWKKYQATKFRKYLLYTIFFFVSAFHGFYGAGMIVLVIAFLFSEVRLTVGRMIKAVVIMTALIFSAYWLNYFTNPKALEYNQKVIKRFVDFNAANIPRKLLAFYNYGSGYSQDPVDFLLGSGPGTFNSRSAFLVGSPTYGKMQFLKSDSQPYYFKYYAYTLWNPANTVRYQDGFMNQPFSSMLSFLGEYGLIITAIIFFGIWHNYKSVKQLSVYAQKGSQGKIYASLYKFLTVYLIAFLILDNFLELPEIIFFILFTLKLIEAYYCRYIIGKEA